MADIENRLRRAEDAEAIRNLIASYGPLADSGDAAGVAALWTQDGEYDVGGFGVSHGREEIAALIESDAHRELMAQGCAHILSPHHITIDGDHAEAQGYSSVYRRRDQRFEAWRVSSNIWHFARQADGSWLVTRRINRPIGV